MFDIKVCTVCLQKDVKCFNINSGGLREDYNLMSGLKTHSGDGLPEYLCFQCVAYVQSCKKFRNKCQRAYFALQEILHRNKEITYSIIGELDCNALNIGPNITYLDTNKFKTRIDHVKFKWMKKNRINIEPQVNDIQVLQHNLDNNEESFDSIVNACAKARYVFETEIKNEGENNLESNNRCEENNIVSDSIVPAGNLFDDDFDGCIDNNDAINSEIECKVDAVEGSDLNEEYATMVPITLNEARAAAEVSKMSLFAHGANLCEVCGRAYNNEKRLKIHKRMHEKHLSGTHLCVLCNYYYKTEFLLKTHMTDKHMYKYLCKKCPEVNFKRTLAKKHYIWAHMQKDMNDKAWCEKRPKWLSSKGVKTNRPEKRSAVKKCGEKLPQDFPTYSPVSQEEQYALVQDRKKTKNFTESAYKCEYCFKGFREVMTFTKHLQKHDPVVSGNLQCDMCKIYCTNARKMYKHMNMTHLFKYSCQMCSYVCYNRGQAKMHYRWHKNVTYDCPHCKKIFTKASTRLTHIRIKHPSTFICNLCGHSFVSENGLYCHKKLAHSREEVEGEAKEVDTSHPLYCAECGVQFRDDAAFATHFGSSNKHADTNLSIKPVRGKSERPRGRPRRGTSDIVNTGVPTSSNCEICKKFLATDVQARRHYEAEHPGTDYLKRYMCDICGHTTKQYANLMVHMRTHTLEKPYACPHCERRFSMPSNRDRHLVQYANLMVHMRTHTLEKPYACPHCERRFSMPSNRDRHLVVHTGEKRYQCQHCNRRFTQSSAVKLHIQTVHLKIPYAPWDKKNRKRRRDMEVTPLPPPVPTHKIVLDSGNYLSAYITYNE